MKRILAVVLAVAILFFPCRVLANQDSQNHYFLICVSGDRYTAFPVDDVLQKILRKPTLLLAHVLSVDLETVYDRLEGEENLVPVGLLVHQLVQDLEGGSTLTGQYPILVNDSHLTLAGTVRSVSFPQGLYLLESSFQIPVGESSNLGKIAVKDQVLYDAYTTSGLFRFVGQGNFTLRGNAPKISLQQSGGTDLTALMQSLSSLVCSYELEGSAELQRNLTLISGQSFSLHAGGMLQLKEGAELGLESGALLDNRGTVGGPIRNGGRINNAAGAVIGGGHFYNLTGGQVYNAGVIASNPIVTAAGSVIANLEGGSLATLPTGEGEYPGKSKESKPTPAPPENNPPTREQNNKHNNDGDSSNADMNHSNGQLPEVVDKAQVAFATYTAVQQAQEQQNRQAVLRLINPKELTAEVLQTLWKEEQQFPLVIYSFSLGERGRGVDVRLAVKPSALPGPCDLSASTFSRQAANTRELFRRHFGGDYRVVSLGYQGDFARPIEVAAKLDLSELNLENLFFYAYHPASNTYREIERPQHWVDSRGFLHFYTPWGGDLLVTNTRLP